MHSRASAFFAAFALLCLIPSAGFAIDAYEQNFEGLIQTDPAALSSDNWLVYGNVSTSSGGYLYGYGPYIAPNDGFAFSQIVLDEGGDEQGVNQLVVFSDYNNADHAAGHIIESNVFQEQVIDLLAANQTWVFDFEAKLGNIAGNSEGYAFIKTLDPSAGWAMTNYITADMTAIPETWAGYSLSVEITPAMEGQILQFGFMNTATLYESAGIFYDNLAFHEEVSSVPDYSLVAGASLHQNYPNPFNPQTQIDFSVEKPGTIALSVYNLAGRQVATLFQGHLDAGDHHVTWRGVTDNGNPAPTGQYYYVLKTPTGVLSRSMVLLK